MLAVSRKVGEWVDVCGGIDSGGLSVVIIEIRGNKVRLGFAAPKEISVHRREVQQRVEAESEVES